MNLDFKVDSCIHLPLTEDETLVKIYKEILRTLTRQCKDYQDSTSDIIKKYYVIDKVTKEILIPRFFPIKNYFPYCNLIYDIPQPQIINIQSRIHPRGPLQQMAMDWCSATDNGILSLPPGEGKTVIAIKAICDNSVKTIIFTHKDFLVEQWKERFLQYTNLKDDDIARLRTSSYEEDLKKPIVLVTVQTLCSMFERIPNLHSILKNYNFGMSVWDECHVIGAEHFSIASMITTTPKVLGLSATPRRSDGNTDIITFHLGDIFIPSCDELTTMIPKIIMVMFNHGLFPKNFNYLMGTSEYDKKTKNLSDGDVLKPQFDKSRYLNMLTGPNSCYLTKMESLIKKVYASERNVLVLSDRIKILDKLSQFCSSREDVGFFLPREKNKDEQLKNKRFVFSTYQSCRDGVDKKQIDCLIMATPVGNWEQAIGRCLRICDGKKTPIVFDIVDTGFKDFKEWGMNRQSKYKQKKWSVEHLNLDT